MFGFTQVRSAPLCQVGGAWLVLALVACNFEPIASDIQDQELKFKAPSHFPMVEYPIENNPPTQEGFHLGKRLFFDTRLSQNNSISCSSCHLQARAFSDASHHGVSIGVSGAIGTRNSPALQNLAFKSEFAWDGGVSHLDFTSVSAITHPLEMKESMASVVEKLSQDTSYIQLFYDVFGEKKITSAYMLQALSQFMLMMVSDQSQYDAWIRGEYQMDINQEAGRLIFKENCSSCHSGVLQSSFEYRDNGIGQDVNDAGRFMVSERQSDQGKFMVPSLRNVALTAPYMHHAKFITLEEVIEHYSDGIQQTENLGREIPQNGFQFSEKEKADIIAFLKTLTDHKFTANPLFHSYEGTH